MGPVETAKAQRGVGSRLLVLGGGLGIAGAGIVWAKHQEKPDFTVSLLPYAEDIADHVLDQHEGVVVGGLAIDVFNDPASIIDVQGRRITASPAFHTPLYRANGTARDYDVLLWRTRQDGRRQRLSDSEQDAIKAMLEPWLEQRSKATGNDQAEVSIFSFEEHSSLFHSATTLADDGTVVLRQGFSAKELPPENMEIWELVLPSGTVIPILNPWEQYWRSAIRFSSGMKVKDVEKLGQLAQKLRSIDGLREQEHSPLCQAYADFYEQMLAGNSYRAVASEWQGRPRNWSRLGNVGALAISRTIMKHGERIAPVAKVVQGNTKLFNRFMSGS